MEKQLIFIIGVPYSGRTTWINKNYLLKENNAPMHIDANNYESLYIDSKISEDSIEESRQWCLKEVKKLMNYDELEKTEPTTTIILSLIACRPDKWREFIELANENMYEIVFKFPTNKFLFYISKLNSFKDQYKFIESKFEQ